MASLQYFFKLNEIVKSWTVETRQKIKSNLLTTGMTFKGSRQGYLSQKKLKSLKEGFTANTGMRDGIVDKVAFRFPKHGVFIEKGAGRGYGGKKKNNLMNSGKRPAKPWFNPILREQHKKLAQQVGEACATAAVKDITSILIK